MNEGSFKLTTLLPNTTEVSQTSKVETEIPLLMTTQIIEFVRAFKSHMVAVGIEPEFVDEAMVEFVSMSEELEQELLDEVEKSDELDVSEQIDEQSLEKFKNQFNENPEFQQMVFEGYLKDMLDGEE